MYTEAMNVSKPSLKMEELDAKAGEILFVEDS
jgi:hypothetical protein